MHVICIYIFNRIRVLCYIDIIYEVAFAAQCYKERVDANTNISNHFTHSFLAQCSDEHVTANTHITHMRKYIHIQPKTIKPIEWHWMRMTVRTFIHVYFLFSFSPYQHSGLFVYEFNLFYWRCLSSNWEIGGPSSHIGELWETLIIDQPHCQHTEPSGFDYNLFKLKETSFS